MPHLSFHNAVLYRIGGWMTLLATIAEKLSADPSTSLSGKTASVIAALALASGAAALIAHIDPVAWVSNPAFSKTTDATPFDARFLPGPASHLLSPLVNVR